MLRCAHDGLDRKTRESARACLLRSRLHPHPARDEHAWYRIFECFGANVRTLNCGIKEEVADSMSHHWWTWAVYGTILATIVGGHALWFGATHDPAIGMRLGAAITGLGIVVTARPFFRTGLRETVNRRLPGRLSAYSSIEHLQQQAVEHVIARPGIVHDVVAERIVGVGLILFGAFLNGYGDLPLRWMGYAAK